MLSILVVMGCISGAREDSGFDRDSKELTGDTVSTNDEDPVVPLGFRFNEFLAKSSTTDDWIELYNAADESVDISGWGLVDDIDEDDPWFFPADSIIDSGEYLIVWADDGEEGEGFHATFKLSADGETVYLLDSSEQVLEQVSFPPLDEDQSYALQAEGSWIVTDQPSIQAANE